MDLHFLVAHSLYREFKKEGKKERYKILKIINYHRKRRITQNDVVSSPHNLLPLKHGLRLSGFSFIRLIDSFDSSLRCHYLFAFSFCQSRSVVQQYYSGTVECAYFKSLAILLARENGNCLDLVIIMIIIFVNSFDCCTIPVGQKFVCMN